jgi:hypothetical protein
MLASVKRIAPLVTTIFLALAPLNADGPKGASDLADASLEDLMNIEVTTAAPCGSEGARGHATARPFVARARPR